MTNSFERAQIFERFRSLSFHWLFQNDSNYVFILDIINFNIKLFNFRTDQISFISVINFSLS